MEVTTMPSPFPIKTFCACILVVVTALAYDNVYAIQLIHILNGNITTVNTAPIIKALQRAKSTDTVTIQINSHGGDIYSGLNLIKAMHESKARAVVVHVQQYALSVAALVALEADKIVLEPKAELDFSIINDNTDNKETLKNTIYQGAKRYASWFKDVLESKNGLGITESEWSTVG